MIKAELPYDIGTFVKIVNPLFDRKNASVDFGTVAAYIVSNDGYSIWVSGYKEPYAGEYMPSEVVPMTDEEIAKVKGENNALV